MTEAIATPEAPTTEIEAPTTLALPPWRHKPTVKYIEMVCAKRLAKNPSMTKAQQKALRTELLTKHGLPLTKELQDKAEAEKQAWILSSKEAGKAERREARLAARAEAKLVADAAAIEALTSGVDDDAEESDEEPTEDEAPAEEPEA
jgi:hypothetical protein